MEQGETETEADRQRSENTPPINSPPICDVSSFPTTPQVHTLAHKCTFTHAHRCTNARAHAHTQGLAYAWIHILGLITAQPSRPRKG